jgi:hypothetical protein
MSLSLVLDDLPFIISKLSSFFILENGFFFQLNAESLFDSEF